MAFLVLPGDRDGTVIGVSTLELVLGDLKSLRTRRPPPFCTAKDDLVCLRTNLEKTVRIGLFLDWARDAYCVPGDILGAGIV